MHFLYFVTFDKKNADNSQEAREYANNILMKNSFCYADGGYFAGGKCDWYVIGGRWSGELQRLQFKKDFFKECKKAKIKTDSQTLKKNKSQCQAIWKKLGGKDVNLYHRDTYQQNGYDDDAMIVDEELWQGIKKCFKQKLNKDTFWNEVEIYDADNYEDYPITKIKKKDLINRWLVVVDYHN